MGIARNCGHDSWSKEFEDKFYDKKTDVSYSWKVQKCKKCGIVRKKTAGFEYLDKLPSETLKK